MHKYTVRLSYIVILMILVLGISTQAFALSINLDKGTINPPEAIGNLSMPYFTTNTVTLHWNVGAPEEDLDTVYDVRYSSEKLTSTNFGNAKIVNNKPIPYSDLQKKGAERSYTVTGLTPGATYHFALKSKYSMTGWSAISAIPSMTLPINEPTTSTFPNTNLNYGKNSPSVSDLQKFLSTQGVYSGPITNYFGKMTRDAVILFQQKNKISPAEGYVGQLTRKVIQTILSTKN